MTTVHKTDKFTTNFEGYKVWVCTCGKETRDDLEHMEHTGWTLRDGEFVRI